MADEEKITPQLRWYRANRDKALANQRAYRARNRDAVNARARERCGNGKCTDSQRQYREAHPDRVWASYLKHEFGMTVAEYDALLQKQQGRCAVCRTSDKDRRLAVDHHHGTGRIRGLLCNKCNRAIGLLQDSQTIILAAAEYLNERH